MKRLFKLTLYILFSLGIFANDSTKTELYYNLDEVVIEENTENNILSSQGNALKFDMQGIKNLPNFLGTADPIRYLQTLPGINTNNELHSGIHIHGCDDYHNIISINGAPIYYPNHLLGLFSPFIPEHFTSIEVEKSNLSGDFPNRIGGNVSLLTKYKDLKKWNISANIGLIGVDATVGVPLAKNHNLFISARASLISLIYSKLLSFQNLSFKYDFQDYNLTYSYNGKDDEVVLSGYYGRDVFKLDQGLAVISGKINWSNLTSSLKWKHYFDNGELNTTAHFSGFQNNINIGDSKIAIKSDANIASCGINSTYSASINEKLFYKVGLEYIHLFNKPMNVDISGLQGEGTHQYLHNANETSVFTTLSHQVVNWFSYNISLRGSWFANKSNHYGALDPRLSLMFKIKNDHIIKVHYGRYHQYIHKAGLLEGGLPTDFFFLADNKYKPEESHSVSCGWKYNIADGKYSVSTELYFKQLYNLIDAKTTIIDIIANGFNYTQDIISGNGRNYGLDIMLAKQTGIITGYISYSLGRSLRMYPEIGIYDYTCPSDYERIHDLNIVLNARINKHWNVGCSFVLCSGTPYTKPEHAYILNGQAVCEYGPMNGSHLPLYHRLDLSAGYWIINKNNQELSINLSIYNVYAHKNAQFVFISDDLYLAEGSLLGTIIPSINIYLKF